MAYIYCPRLLYSNNIYGHYGILYCFCMIVFKDNTFFISGFFFYINLYLTRIAFFEIKNLFHWSGLAKTDSNTISFITGLQNKNRLKTLSSEH